MGDCPITGIDFDLFWKISAAVVIPNLFNLFKLLIDFPSKADEYAKLIRQSIGRDLDTGIPFLPQKRINKLLAYNLSKRLSWLINCFFCAIATVLMYAMFYRIPRPFSSKLYDCLIFILTYLGLAPTIVSVVIGLDIASYFVRLYREAPKKPA